MTQIGIDVGGSKTALGLVEDGDVLDRILIDSHGERGPESWTTRVARAVADLAAGPHGRPDCVGVGIAGQVDGAGHLALAPNLGWTDVDVAGMVRDATGFPTRVLGDVQAIAVGEWLHGAARGARDAVAIFLGTGVGAGVILDGELRRGAGGSLGEIGHLLVDPEGPPCTCGSRGCLEVYAGGWGIAARARARIEAGDATSIDADRPDARAVAGAAGAGDAVAREILADAGSALGAGLVAILNLYNPEVVVIGGGVARGIPELIDVAVEHAADRALPAPLARARFEAAALDVDAGVVGAAGWAARLSSGALRT